MPATRDVTQWRYEMAADALVEFVLEKDWYRAARVIRDAEPSIGKGLLEALITWLDECDYRRHAQSA